jgi:hypothetical protein
MLPNQGDRRSRRGRNHSDAAASTTDANPGAGAMAVSASGNAPPAGMWPRSCDEGLYAWCTGDPALDRGVPSLVMNAHLSRDSLRSGEVGGTGAAQFQVAVFGPPTVTHPVVLAVTT